MPEERKASIFYLNSQQARAGYDGPSRFILAQISKPGSESGMQFAGALRQPFMYACTHCMHMLSLGRRMESRSSFPLKQFPCAMLQSIHALRPVSRPVPNQSIDTLRKACYGILRAMDFDHINHNWVRCNPSDSHNPGVSGDYDASLHINYRIAQRGWRAIPFDSFQL